MWNWLKSLFSMPEPAGPPQSFRTFSTGEPTLTRDGIRPDQGGWCVEAAAARTVRLFEVTEPGVEQCMITYRADIKTEDVRGRAYLEMWCRLPGRGEFFSKGVQQPVSGTTDWSRNEIPFYLKKDQKPDLIKLNLVVEGTGKVWLRNLQLLQTPLKA
jgi:hypothetical protein